MTSKKETARTSGKRYDLYCSVARALDVVGERWTLLVVRSLLMGPQRYTDLRQALPGIATDLLTARLRTLEEAGYVRRRELPRPAPATVYELTDSGRQLGRVVFALAQVGIELLGLPSQEEHVNAAAVVLSLRARYRPGRTGAADDSYQLEIDGEPFAVTVNAGSVETTRGQAPDPRITITTSAFTLAQLLAGGLDPKTAIASGDLRVDGPSRGLGRFLAAFGSATDSKANNGAS